MDYRRQYRAGDPTVVADGLDVCAAFDLLLHEDTRLGAPAVKLNKVDVLGGDGTLDLSEAYQDDVLFGERSHDLVFLPWGPRREGFEYQKLKTAMYSKLLGRRMDYTVSLDPEYVYTGRWEAAESDPPYIAFHIDADPWKRGTHMVYDVQGAGGTNVRVENGRRHVIPTITTNGPTMVKYGDDAWEIAEAGSWTIDGLRLVEGESDIYVNSAPTLCDTTLQDMLDRFDGVKWEDIPAGTRLSDHFFTKGDPPEGAEYAVTITYDIYEL